MGLVRVGTVSVDGTRIKVEGSKQTSIADARLVALREKLSTRQARRINRNRAKTVEPGFGTIKGARHFRQFLICGLSNVQSEWKLVCTAYNMKRIWNLANGFAVGQIIAAHPTQTAARFHSVTTAT